MRQSDAMAHLRLLGGALLEDPAGHPVGLVSRRHPIALLALLATAPSRSLSRTKLVGLLWPDSPEAKGRSRLNTYIHQIRSELGEEVLISTGEDIRLDDTRLRCDVWDFERALAEEDENAAVALYRGPYLDGFRLDGSPEFEQRVDLDRSRLRRAYHTALEARAESATAAGDPTSAARWWRERADDDPSDSRVAVRLMRALAEAGNRAEALRVAEAHSRLLETELDASPSAEVTSLAESLRSRDPSAFDPPLPESRPRVPGSPAGRPARDLAPVPSLGGAQVPRHEARDPDHTEVVTDARPGEIRDGAPPSSAARRRRMLRAAVLPVVGFVATGAVAAYVAGAGNGSAGNAADRAIAVLPFERLAGDSPAGEESADALAEGLHSDLSTRLAAIPGLDVRPRASVLRFRGDDRPPSEIANELEVRWLLLAEVQRSGQEVRLHARLVDAHSGRQVWTSAFRRKWRAGSLFDMQAEVAASIAGALQVRLRPEDERRLGTVPTENTAAWELYLHARELDRGPHTGGARDRKIALYRRALELDPDFAESWAWLADAYIEKAWAGEGLEVWADSARRAVGRAMELDPDLADAHSQLGDVHWTLGRIEDAIASYERALALQPSHGESINNLLTLLHRRGRLAEMMKWTERARRLAPSSSLPVEIMALLNAQLGRDEMSDRWFEHARARGHDLRWMESHVALYYRRDLERARGIIDGLAGSEERFRIDRRRGALALYEGDLEEARRHYRRLYPGVGWASSPIYRGLMWAPLGLAHVLDRLGDPAQAREIAREVVDATERQISADPDHLPRHRLAVANLILGDTVAALDWLEASVDGGYRDVRVLETVPTLTALRDQPRFRALLYRMRVLLAEERRRIEAEGWGAPADDLEPGSPLTSG